MEETMPTITFMYMSVYTYSVWEPDYFRSRVWSFSCPRVNAPEYGCKPALKSFYGFPYSPPNTTRGAVGAVVREAMYPRLQPECCKSQVFRWHRQLIQVVWMLEFSA